MDERNTQGDKRNPSKGRDTGSYGNTPQRRSVYTNSFSTYGQSGHSAYTEPKNNRGYELISFEVDVVNIADYIAKTVVSKQKDYGPANIMKSPFGPQQGLIVRLYDKVARLANLNKENVTPENESIRDTFVDIAGYAIIGLMVLDGTFPKE